MNDKPTSFCIYFKWEECKSVSLDRVELWFPVTRSWFAFQFSSVQFSLSVVSDSLRPHESQQAPGVYSNSCPSSRWCHPAISSSVVPFSFCPLSLPAPGSFSMSQLFSWCGQSTGVSASASVLPVNTQDWSPLGWTAWISLPLYNASIFWGRWDTWLIHELETWMNQGNWQNTAWQILWHYRKILCYPRHTYHFACLLCMRAKSLQLCLTLCDPMDCGPPGSFVRGILQARILE